ncbi:MAG TPA: hypothetical protein VFU35_06595 [Jatrophihabitans sp.]|nr:hypothetical protein [Jatrophihabitans sp.]
MGRHWRWVAVAIGVAVLLCLPLAARLLPAGSSSVDAATLLARVQASARVPYAGYAQSTGGLALPIDTGEFSLADLLGGTSHLRVWWRGASDWRVDSVTASGEVDLHHDTAGTWTWNYESNTTELADERPPPVVRVPRADDLVPGNLARRLLSHTTAAQVSSLPNARIAGRHAAGLRMHVNDKRSTIDHIDVWALPANGVPVRVITYGVDGSTVVSTTMLDLSLQRPSARTTGFEPPSGSRFPGSGFGDVVSAINEFGSGRPPDTLGGLARIDDPRLGAVGDYGGGVTQLVAIPLNPRLAGNVVAQVSGAPGAVEDERGIALTAGPVSLQLSPPTGFGARWLLVGTVTAATLRAAVPSLPPAQGLRFGR